MAYEPLSTRLSGNKVPLVLAGPILRRVEPDQVTVWIALREARMVTLEVFAGGAGAGTVLMGGSRATVAIGDKLHIAAVTATGAALVPEQLYSYDLDFDGETLDGANVLKIGTGGRAALAYAGTTHPSFSLPPLDMAGLRVVHGSCRKPHAPGQDALTALDLIIADAAKTPGTFARNRPHQLFLTGDQIYGDDVADAMLEMITESGATLLGWEETLPLTAKKPSEFAPGERQETVFMGKLTSDHAKSHLFGLAEYYAAYLFAWSDAIWPATLPETGPDHEREGLELFKDGLPSVRRALANVPTYMIFDDHEITDDWFINRRWCAAGVPSEEPGGALAHPLGRRVILNGLIAYALFQAWGNTPEQFDLIGSAGEPGTALLDAAEAWSTARGSGAATLATLEQRVGLAPALTAADDAFVRPAGALRWHYSVALAGRPYEVVVLDARTARAFPRSGGAWGSAGLLSPAAFTEQLESLPPAPGADGVTIVIAPAPVLGVPFIEENQKKATGADVFANDAEAWSLDERTFQRLLGWAVARRSRIVMLSGDVHYAFAARLCYWATRPYQQPARPALLTSVVAQLTASALHNENYAALENSFVKNSDRQHRGGYNHFYVKNTAPPDDVKGWNVKPSATDVKIGLEKRFFSWSDVRLRDPAVLHHCDDLPGGSVVNVVADWRYRVKWLGGQKSTALPAPTPINASGGSPNQATIALSDFQRQYAAALRDYLGRDVVGRNNIGELLFDWPAGTGKQVRQRLWWTPDVNAPFAPITSHTISLDPDQSPGL